MADVVNGLWIRLFYTLAEGRPGGGGFHSKFLTIRDPAWEWRLVKTLIWGPLPYYSINFQYTLLSMLAVMVGISGPDVRICRLCVLDVCLPPRLVCPYVG